MIKPVKFAKELIRFLFEIYEKRFLIFELVKRDFKNRYTGSYLGLLWTFLHPLMMMLIMWFVFTFGLKVGKGSDDVPFVAYMFTAQIIWNFFADSLSSSTNVIGEYSFLVKKINFRLSILPIVKLLSALLIHIIFIIIVMVILAVMGIYPTWYLFQLPYYMICVMLLSLGLSWITSSINVFVKDTGYIVSILLQFGFWVTPIFWNIKALPASWHKFVYFNPMTYIVSGYRDAFLYGKPFWQADLFMTGYFWSVTVVLLLLGMIIFKRLRPHFADVI